METEITNENLSIPTTYASSTFQELIDRDCTLSPITRIPPIDTMYYYAKNHIPRYNTISTYPNDIEYNPNTNGVTNFSYSFYNMKNCRDSIDSIMNRFDWNSCTDMSYAFSECSNLTGLISNIPDKVINMSRAFESCYNLTGSIPNIPNSVTNMYRVFHYCSNLTGSIPNIPNNVTDMYSAFCFCSNLTGSIPNIPNNVTDMSYAFYYCNNLSSSNVYIHSNNVFYIDFCFFGIGNIMNIYVHANTVTYNRFIREYGNSSTIHIKTF